MKPNALLLVPLLAASSLVAAPAPPPDARTRAAGALEGVWEVVSYEGDAEVADLVSAEGLRTGKLTLRRGAFSWEEFQEGALTVRSTWTGFRVDPARRPKGIDFILSAPGGQEIVYRGIYELDGDTLRVCRCVRSNGPRPASFSAARGSGRVLAVWRRAGR